MDTSQEYIIMCKESEEIQKLIFNREISPHDCMFGRLEGPMNQIHLFSTSLTGNFQNRDEFLKTWTLLPRQDQLQEMIKISFPKIHDMTGEICESRINELHQRFHYFVHSFHTHFTSYNTKWVFDTYEKYWLAFVMFDNYNKTWHKENQIWQSL